MTWMLTSLQASIHWDWPGVLTLKVHSESTFLVDPIGLSKYLSNNKKSMKALVKIIYSG